MIDVKYNDRVEALSGINTDSDLPPFDIQRLKSKSWIGKLAGRIFGKPLWLLKCLRRFCPVLKIGRIVLLTRADDVQEVLTNTKVFTVPFGNEMRLVSGGSDFILGMNNGAVYRAQKSLVLTAFPPDQMAEKIGALTAKRSQLCMRSVASDFDPISELFSTVGVQICEDYFGLYIGNKQRFYESSLAVSSLLFADISGSKPVRELAMAGAKHILKVIDLSIDQIKKNNSTGDSPLEKLVQAHLEDANKVPLDDVRAIMMGMVLGFLPTTMLASGKALEVILEKPQARAAIEAAISKNDDVELESAIMEAMRFNPIQIGPFRLCQQDYVVSANSKPKTIRKNSLVIPSTFSAMFDPSRVSSPDEFKPSRNKQDSMIFGYGLHSCIGAPMARAFCTQTFKALFSMPKLKPQRGAAGKMTWLGIFPEHISMSWHPAEKYGDSSQSLSTVCIPLKKNSEILALKAALEELGNVAAVHDGQIAGIANALAALDKVHFASGCVSDAFHDGEREREPGHLLFEICGDGEEGPLIEQFAHAIDPFIGDQIKAACNVGAQESLPRMFLKNRLKGVGPLGKNLGLRFNGTPGHSLTRIKKEAALSKKIYQLVCQEQHAKSTNPLENLKEIRREISELDEFSWAFAPVRNRISEPPKGLMKYLWEYLKGAWSLLPVSIFLAFVALNFQILGGVKDGWWYNMWHVGAAISMTVIGGILIIGTIVGVSALYLRSLEQSDSVDLILPDQENYDAITSKENQIKQNHMFAVSRLKDSSLRAILLRAVLWWIELSAGYKNTPGVISVINTIHFARWVRIPGTKQLIFFSNYSGSWESYLEDFITKASSGLTSIWTNTIGFPRTKYLYQFGAKLSEPFKYWARQQQRPTPFWYVAYPNLTTNEIRKNALVRQGFAQIDDIRHAEQWFSLFGSAYRPQDVLDKSNIQSLVFGGMGKRLPASKLLFLSLGENHGSAQDKQLIEYVFSQINFGERLARDNVWQIAFTASGLHRLGISNNALNSNVFANVFCQGMHSAARSKILGDIGENDPSNWLWGSAEKHVDLVLMCYATELKNVDANLKEFRTLLDKSSADLVFEQNCFVKRDEQGYAVEPFGFADGISQPIIRGTRKSYRTDQSDQLLAPGEILCGYPDERGNIAPSPSIEIENDIFNILPKEPPQSRPNTLKDFGYNGTYLVIRQLQQHTQAFDQFCEAQADKLSEQRGLDKATPEWIGAKMVGRWKDGRSLVSYPSELDSGQADNTFRYRKEDPQGLQCPLGAHMRRANPRDSLGDDREVQIGLANRHRILRVGRSYNNDKGDEIGTMFMCMNSNIERQFEFVQQSWINNSNFHGLIEEKDTLVAAQCPAANKYTIPTDQGVVTIDGIDSFVKTRGGSYFFMPGKQALDFLASL